MPCQRSRSVRVFVGVLVAHVLLMSCAPASPEGRGQPPAAGQAQTGLTNVPRGTLRIAWAGEPPTLSPKMGAPGGSAFQELAVTFNSALTISDHLGNSIPAIAREIPTVDNGGWVVNPDGSMVTTYHLRENGKWHDGAPLTAYDFVFAFRVYTNPAVSLYRRDPEPYMASVQAADDHTLVINWRSPYYRANRLRYLQLDPLPRHLLEETYDRDLDAFVNGAHWTTGYVGSGPFRLEKWDPGVSITARAHMDWVLGPPKAAVLDIRFIADANTILANLMSGEVDISAHPWFPPLLAAQIRDQWVGGGMGLMSISESRFQFMNLRQNEVPGWQPALADARVRQAMLSAIDRASLIELLGFGLGGSVADAFIKRTDPIFPEVDRALAKYPYDPARAARLFADAGWRRATADGPLVNAAGETLAIELRTTGGSATGEQEATLITNNWKALGIEPSISILPRVLSGNPEINATYPGGATSNRPIEPESFSWITSMIPTAQSRWLGLNQGGFSDPEVDRLYPAVLTAITPQTWVESNVALHKRMSEVLGVLPLYYPVDVIVARHPINGPSGHHSTAAYSWNIYEWGFAE
jgi:peptide/nickel transport system substrate-binding protein